MTKLRYVNINVPFDGFYESLYSAAIDQEESQHIEYMCGESEDGEKVWPKALRISEQDMFEMFMRHTSYDIAYRHLAAEYAASVDYMLGEAFDMTAKAKRHGWNATTGKPERQTYNRPSVRAKFEAMTSPREYNFQTDRIFMDFPASFVRKMFAISKAEKHETLSKVIEGRFTSRSGFSSFYSNDLEDWICKPVSDWDHNELGTLLIAACLIKGFDFDESRWPLYEMTVDGETAYTAWSNAVDWPAVEKAMLEARAEKLLEYREENPAKALAWETRKPDLFAALVAVEPLLQRAETESTRCTQTPDMFA